MVSALPGNCGSHSARGRGWGLRCPPRAPRRPLAGPSQAPRSAAATCLCCPQRPHSAESPAILCCLAGVRPHPGQCRLPGERGCLSSDFPSARLESAPGWAGVALHPGQKAPAEGPPASPLPRGLSASPLPGGLPHAGADSRHLQPFPRPALVPFKICNGNKRNPQPSLCENAAGRGRDPAASAGRHLLLLGKPDLPPRLPGTGVRFSSLGDSSAPCILCFAFLAGGAAGSRGGGRGAASPPRRRCRAGSRRPPRLQKPQAPAAAARLCPARRAPRQQRAGRFFPAPRQDWGGHRWLQTTWLGLQALRWSCGGGGACTAVPPAPAMLGSLPHPLFRKGGPASRQGL